ncbi:MAG TPA: hypothetical protein VLL25_20080 [Acidimicrobiales bacterium]|nr:hypothetical protein [Acidimicrobiales bacterium]
MSEQEALAPSYGASVIVDIGGDVGAVVLHTPDWLAGDEIEIRRTDRKDEKPTHAAVRARRMESGDSLAAVFPAVAAGQYTLHSLRHPAVGPRNVTVIGGRVTEATW